MGDWQHFAHGADIGVRGYADAPTAAFEQAARALTAVVTDLTQVRPVDARGEPVDVVRHTPAVEIKGATFTELSVRQDAEGRWCGQCVLDV